MKNIRALYEALIALMNLRVLRSDEATPVFTWQDLWYQQTDFPELAEAIEFPACFYEFATDQIELAGMDSKAIDLVVSIFVCTNNYQDTHSESVERGEALAFLETLEKVDRVLHGQAVGGVGTFRQIAFAPYDNRTNMIVYRMDYAVTYLDDAPTLANHQTETHLFEEEVCLAISKDTAQAIEVPAASLGFDLD